MLTERILIFGERRLRGVLASTPATAMATAGTGPASSTSTPGAADPRVPASALSHAHAVLGGLRDEYAPGG